MRQSVSALFTAAGVTAALIAAAPALAATTAQSKSCASDAAAQHLTGAAARSFRATCVKGALKPKTPTGSKNEITAPSGSDRTDRSKQCAKAADAKGLKDKERKEFNLSCLASAGPVSESETHAKSAAPAKAIPGLGIEHNGPH